MIYPDLVLAGIQSVLLLAALAAPAAPVAATWPIEHLHQATMPLSRLPAADRATITRMLRPRLGPLFQGQSPQVVAKALLSFRVERLRLDGLIAVAVEPSQLNDLCSPTGNCSFWIIDLRHRRFLLDTIGVQMFTADTAPPHGMPDIVTRMHGSATESDLTRWSFQGNRYLRSACAALEYADVDGKARKEPTITSHPCNSEGNDRAQ